MPKWIKDMFTQADGQSAELASIIGFILFCAFLGFCYNEYIVLAHAFSPKEFGEGSGLISTGIGAHKYMSGKVDN